MSRLRVPYVGIISVLVPVMSPLGARAAELSGSLWGYLPADTYRIVGDIDVPAGQTLTLAPGVVFEFEASFWSEYEFDVWGTLLAAGTAEEPIIFRAAGGVSEYNYIRLASSGSVLRHCTIEDAGKVSLVNEGGLWIDNCSPLIEDSLIADGSWHGVSVTGSAAIPDIRRTWTLDNTNDGFHAASNAGMHLEHCVAVGNGADGIEFSGGDNRVVGCLVHGNGEDGIDCNGLEDYGAVLVNCTVGAHPSEGLSDAGNFEAYNCLVVDDVETIGQDKHSLFTSDLAFFDFVNPAGGDYRLGADSPAANYGTRFGTAGSLLPPDDLAGSGRIHGIVDAGAYESGWDVDPGTDGVHFSVNLLEPRLGQPVLRQRGETFPARIGLPGSYGLGDCSAHLVNDLGETVPLETLGLAAQDLVPGSDLAVLLHAPGLETIQELEFRIPEETPADFYRIEIAVGSYQYVADRAVRVYESYPESWGFIHITDPHIGYDEEEYTALERLRFFVTEANFLDPELVVITGDICENQHLDHNWPLDFMDAIAELRMPAYVIAGNHDHYTRGSAFHPGGLMRYFREINRFENSLVTVGSARFYGLNTGHDLGLLELYRCRGPLTSALDWVEADLAELGLDDRPRFLLMHGPNYDYFSWNDTNTGRVRDMMNANDFGLGLAGHTHRFETFLNEGDNWFGRNDFEHEDDWEIDVPFPGYPLHVQTSSLGKEEHLSYRIVEELEAADDPRADAIAADLAPVMEPRLRGIFGDDIGWRWVQVDGTEIGFFTADTDGDGYRNTEDPWLLGEIQFAVIEEPDGSIVSTVENKHHETWQDVLHYVPAEPDSAYEATGGTLLGRLPDGTAVVAVDQIGAQSVSIVTLTPEATCPADLDGDGHVDVADLIGLLGAWGSDGPGADLAEPFETVDVADLLILLGAWGACP